MKFEVGLLLLLVYGHEYDSLERCKGYRQQIARHGAFKNLRKYLRIIKGTGLALEVAPRRQ
jgi:hypothetical protein